MSPELVRGKRLRLIVDVEVTCSATFDHAARTLAIVTGEALKELHPNYRLHGFEVSGLPSVNRLTRFDLETGEIVT